MGHPRVVRATRPLAASRGAGPPFPRFLESHNCGCPTHRDLRWVGSTDLTIISCRDLCAERESFHSKIRRKRELKSASLIGSRSLPPALRNPRRVEQPWLWQFSGTTGKVGQPPKKFQD